MKTKKITKIKLSELRQLVKEIIKEDSGYNVYNDRRSSGPQRGMATRLSMKSLQEEINEFEQENVADIKHSYQIGSGNGYYTLQMYSKGGENMIRDISTSAQFTKRKGVSPGTLKACRYAWLISRWE